MAFQTTSDGLLLWRFIAGIGIGVEIITIDAYITELVPSWMRGRAFAVNQAVMFIAVPVVAFLAWWLVPLSPYGIDGWRWVVLIGAAASMVIWVVRLLRAGKPALAGAPRPDRGSAQDPGDAGSRGRRRRRASEASADMAPARARAASGFCRSVQAALSVAGRAVHGVQFLPGLRLLRLCQLGADAAWSKRASRLQKACNIPSSSPSPIRSRRCSPQALPTGFERKWIICGACVAIIAFGMAFSQFTEPALLILSGVLLTAANMTMSYAYHAYQTEVFPTAIRARASGLVYSMSRISATFSGFIVAYMLRDGGVNGVFGLITAAMVLVIIVIGDLRPECARQAARYVAFSSEVGTGSRKENASNKTLVKALADGLWHV